MNATDRYKRHTIYAYKERGKQIMYIGQRCGSLSKRAGKDGIGYRGQYVWEWISKVGWDNIEEIILEKNLSQSEANEQERHYIKLYNTIYPNGFNMDQGGHANSSLSTERCVVQLYKNDIVNVFRNVTQAAFVFDISPTTLDKYCKNKKMCEKYQFEYRKIDPDIYDILELHNDKRFCNIELEVHRKWNDYEIAYIKSSYEILSIEEMSHELQRSGSSIISKLRELGCNNSNYWSDDECELLIEKYENDKENILEYFPNRSERAINAKALRLGLIKTKKWTEEMDEIIRIYYPIEGADVCKRLPNKSKSACYNRARILGVKITDWNDRKKSLLIQLCDENNNYKNIAKKMRVSVPTLKLKMNEYGISKKEKNFTSKYKYVYFDKSRNVYRTKLPKGIPSKQFQHEIEAALFCKDTCTSLGLEYPYYEELYNKI